MEKLVITPKFKKMKSLENLQESSAEGSKWPQADAQELPVLLAFCLQETRDQHNLVAHPDRQSSAAAAARKRRFDWNSTPCGRCSLYRHT